MKSSLVIVAIGIALMAGPVNAGQTPAAPKPAPPAGAPAAQTPPAAAQPAAAPAPPRPFPEGAKIAYVNVQRIASESSEGQAATKRLTSLREEKEKDLVARNAKFEEARKRLETSASVLSESVRDHAAEGSRAAADRPPARHPGRPEGGRGPAERAAARVPAQAPAGALRGVGGQEPAHGLQQHRFGRGLGRSRPRHHHRHHQEARRRRGGRAEEVAPSRPEAGFGGQGSRSARARFGALRGRRPGAPVVRPFARPSAHHHPARARPAVLSLPGAPRGRRRLARARPRARSGEERDGQRRLLPGPFPGPAGDAGRADARVAGPGRGHPAARPRRRGARDACLAARRRRRQVPPPDRARATGSAWRCGWSPSAARSPGSPARRWSTTRWSPRPRW